MANPPPTSHNTIVTDEFNLIYSTLKSTVGIETIGGYLIPNFSL